MSQNSGQIKSLHITKCRLSEGVSLKYRFAFFLFFIDSYRLESFVSPKLRLAQYPQEQADPKQYIEIEDHFLLPEDEERKPKDNKTNESRQNAFLFSDCSC